MAGAGRRIAPIGVVTGGAVTGGVETRDDRPALAVPRSFFARPAAVVARELLGMTLVREMPGGSLRARIVETEAYEGPHDLACHTAKGRTRRTETMYGPAGTAYVYLVYGMHHCLNVVTGEPGVDRLGGGRGEAVLLRAAEALDGWSADLRGPGRLARACALDRSLDGHDLRHAPLRVLRGPRVPENAVACTPRIGVAYAGDWAHRPLRFIDARSKALSGPARLNAAATHLARVDEHAGVKRKGTE